MKIVLINNYFKPSKFNVQKEIKLIFEIIYKNLKFFYLNIFLNMFLNTFYFLIYIFIILSIIIFFFIVYLFIF